VLDLGANQGTKTNLTQSPAGQDTPRLMRRNLNTTKGRKKAIQALREMEAMEALRAVQAMQGI
jgi:hypothetical protein